MSITSSEVIWRKSQVINNQSTNGGLMSAVVATDGAKNNIFPDVTQAERDAGSVVYRKMFIHNTNAEATSGLPLLSPRIFIESITPGDDRVYIFSGTQDDIQSAVEPPPRLYGAGTVAGGPSVGADISVSDTQIIVLQEDPSAVFFQNTDVIRLSDKTSVTDGAGAEEYLTVTNVDTVTNSGYTTLTVAESIANAYTVAGNGVKCASCIEPADIEATFDNPPSIPQGSGTFDALTYFTVFNLGTVEDTWTLTIQPNTDLVTIVGANTGQVGTTFSRSSTIAPANPTFGGSYFSIDPNAWGGTWADTDTLIIDTHPASAPIWYYRDIPIAAGSLTGNSVIVGIDGESS